MLECGRRPVVGKFNTARNASPKRSHVTTRNFGDPLPYLLAYKPPYVARARQMPSLRRGHRKGIYYVDGLCALQILLGRDSDPSLGGDL
jgi:hypothetical protein